MIRIGALISGRGSNLGAIIAAGQQGRLLAEVALVVSNNAKAPGLTLAQQAGIPVLVTTAEEEIIAGLQQARVSLVVLAGYMRLVGAPLLRAFPQKIMNIHPALLPAFPGLNAPQQAWDYGVRVSGATVHFVDEGMDTGPIILQEACAVARQDSPATLAQKILQIEHKLYPEAIQLFATGRLTVQGRKVIIN